MARLGNPFAFSRGPVTVIATIIYAALLTILIVIQVDLPDPPKSAVPVKGINLTEAWHDLQLLTAQYHPYNSHRNDFVHDWLVSRIKQILKDNNASKSSAYIFDDALSNLTSSSGGVRTTSVGITVYFEGTNIITYIRGEDDDKQEWWKEQDGEPSARHGVLVNAHYDSVSTGYGSTDDGVGVVSVLQLIKYFSTKDNTPKNGLVLLLNNGEEDFLNGARAFGQHPMSKFVYTFLNLEGAGAGGRAALFRSTDDEVTQAYAKSPYPFGTVISGDAFERGLVRSQTDYVVFNGNFGYRGLDVAFIGPRSRYHTDQDDSRHTGKKALWHMLSTAVATTDNLVGRGIEPDDESHRAIWFDLLGRVLVLMQSHTFFALSVTLLVVGPLVLLLTMTVLLRSDKLYLFANSKSVYTGESDQPVSLYGWRGCFRYPFIYVIAAAGPVALAYLLFKENEQIVHSSSWPIWAMMASAFICVAWFLARFADYLRPSALCRAYGFGWLSLAWWAILVVALIHEEQFHISGGYFTLFYAASTFLATWLSYLELFSLPKKKAYAHQKVYGDEDTSQPPSRPASSRRPDESRTNDDNDEDATEQSSLLRPGRRSVYKTVGADDREDSRPGAKHTLLAEHDEQEWSPKMWNWLWLAQFIVLIPINVVLLGQLGFYLTEALHQTGQDGSSVFIVYLGIAIVTIFMFSPMVPMIHRLTWHLPIFLFLVLVGTIIYNLLAFPFSPQNRLKVYFQQQLDLDHGNNTVSLVGLAPYVDDIIDSIPSSAGQSIDCVDLENRQRCSWTGPSPQIVENTGYTFAKSPYRGWLHHNVSIVDSSKSASTARFNIGGVNTKACKLKFEKPISGVYVHGQAPEDARLPSIPKHGSDEVRLWSRTWNRTWTVDITWDTKEHGKNMTGQVMCLWSDVNQKGVIPAFDEVRQYVPTWVAVSKLADGLVEGYKSFSI